MSARGDREVSQALLGLFDLEFDREAQLELCAALLGALRDRMQDAWWGWTPRTYHRWSREQTDIAETLIRRSSESRDCLRTADFMTRRVANLLEESLKAAPHKRGGHFRRDLIRNEHMVPGRCVFRILTRRDPAGSAMPDLASVLGQLNYRALVSKASDQNAMNPAMHGISEAAWLDRGERKSSIPDPGPAIAGWPGPALLARVDFKFHGLIRYDAAGLLGELIPVSERARQVLTEYHRRFKREGVQDSTDGHRLLAAGSEASAPTRARGS